MKKKNLLILPIAVLALGVATSCNNNNSGSAYFKDSTIKEYEKYFEFNGKDFTPLDAGLANYVLMQSGANLYNANKVTNNYTRSLKGNFSNDLSSSLEEVRKEKQEKNYDVSDLANRDASNVLINSDNGRDISGNPTVDKATNTLHEGYESYELFSNDIIEYNSEDSIYSIDNDNNRTLVEAEKEKDTYWYELEDDHANVYTQYDGEKYGFTASHQNLYTTLDAMSKEEASRELQFYFNNIVVGFAQDSLSSSSVSVGDVKNYAYTSGDDIYIVNRTEGSSSASTANMWVQQYLNYLNSQTGTAARQQAQVVTLAIKNMNVYLVNNPLKPMTKDIMIGCGLDYQKFLSYFLPCVPVNMSVIKVSKHDFGWGVDYNAWKSQLLLLKNENEKVLSKPIAYSSYYDISEVTYSKPASHASMKYDPAKEMDNPFNIRLKIWEMRDYGESRILEEHPDRYEIDEENPMVDEIAYSSDSKFALSSYNEIYDLTSYYWQAYSDLKEKKIRVYSGYIDMDYFSRPAGGIGQSLKPGTGFVDIVDYESYPVFSLEVVGSVLETPIGLIGYDDIPSSNLGKQNNEYFACPLDISDSSDYYYHKRIVSNVPQLDGYNVTFYVDADPEHLLTTYGQIIDYKYQEGLTISTDGGIKDIADVIDVPDFDIREV